MSSTYGESEYDWTERRPDKPLVVKCGYDGTNKRITFSSTRICTFDLLRHRVEQCFSLSATSYAITYTDDDGEITDIATDSDLTEAIQYFNPGADDPPISSAASILSGRSFGRGKITLRVKISVDYDGPSLSDTSSLASLEDFQNKNGSAYSLSFSSPSQGEIDDDSVTVSSKDLGSKYDIFRSKGPRTVMSGPSRSPRPPLKDWDDTTVSSIPQSSQQDDRSIAPPKTDDSFSIITEEELLDPSRYPEDPSLVFERLKMQENQTGPVSPGLGYVSSPLQTERGAAWLRDQNARTMKSMLGKLPEPSESDQQSIPDDTHSVLSGELALRKDPRGKFYYDYTSGTSAPSTTDDASSFVFDSIDPSLADTDELSRSRMSPPIPTRNGSEPPPRPSSSTSSSHSHPANHRSHSEPMFISKEFLSSVDIPAELLPFLSSANISPPEHPTDCSHCGALLETLRYVCSTCGEKGPRTFPNSPSSSALSTDDDRTIAGSFGGIGGKGKGKDTSSNSGSSGSSCASLHSYPPRPPAYLGNSPSVSSWTLVADDNPFHDSNAVKVFPGNKPLPAIPIPSFHPFPSMLSSSPSNQSSTSFLTIPGSPNHNGHVHPSEQVGYELCFNCIESVGVIHAIDSITAAGSSPASTPSSAEAFSQLSRSAPKKKGQLRHAYLEKVWGARGWDDVEQDDIHSPKCSTCNITIVNKRYKCASCKNFNLCRACYSQVHEIHPAHAFLVVPEKPPRSKSEPVLDIPTIPPENTGEESMIHPGVKCAHCLQDIVGARFHCAICNSVDICSNCESAGLPGNLDSADGGHSSSHIMIKIPYPLPSDELQIASSKAKQLWDKDAPTVEGASRSRRDSLMSSYARTVMGPIQDSGGSMDGESESHGVRCDECNKMIMGVRYQCAVCVSKPKGFNLCSNCEARSYVVHDPMHIFFKLPRPVDTPIECEYQMLPILYRVPAGPPGGVYNSNNPREYLQHLHHTLAVCDRCMLRITGEWFRCAYCAKDLCDGCEAVDTHDNTHFFMVLKSTVDMQHLRRFAQMENSTDGGPPVVPYPVYNS